MAYHTWHNSSFEHEIWNKHSVLGTNLDGRRSYYGTTPNMMVSSLSSCLLIWSFGTNISIRDPPLKQHFPNGRIANHSDATRCFLEGAYMPYDTFAEFLLISHGALINCYLYFGEIRRVRWCTKQASQPSKQLPTHAHRRVWQMLLSPHGPAG